MTGMCLIDADTLQIIYTDDITARSFISKEDYCVHHLHTIRSILYAKLCKNRDKSTIVVMEDYILYANKTQLQINSRMETPKLIGIIQL